MVVANDIDQIALRCAELNENDQFAPRVFFSGHGDEQAELDKMAHAGTVHRHRLPQFCCAHEQTTPALLSRQLIPALL